MKDIFKKTLSLFACLVLVGQTLLTSVVTAVEVGVKDGYLGEEGTILEEDVATEDVDSDAKVLAVEKVQDLGEAKSLSDELKVVDVAKNLDDNKAETATTEVKEKDVCGKEIGTDLAQILSDKGIPAQYTGEKITINYDKDKIDDEITKKYVGSLIYYLLLKGIISRDSGDVSEYTGPELKLWNVIGDKYELNMQTVSELTDLFIGGKAGFSVNGKCEILVEFGEPEEPEGCMKKSDIIADLASYFDKESVSISPNGEIVINYNGKRDDLLIYVETLIDYLLKNGKVDNDPRVEMGLWKAIGNTYELNIQTVSELTDLLLRGENTFTVSEKDKDCDSHDVVVKFGGNHDEDGNSGTNNCEGSQSSSAVNLSKLAEILNNDDTVLANNFSLQATGSDLYLVTNGDSVDFIDMRMVTSLIDYLLYKNISDEDKYGFLWEAMSGSNLSPNIETVVDLIDILLNQGLKVGSEVAIRTEGGCFYLIIVKDNGNSDSSTQDCNLETIKTAMGVVKDAVDVEIKSKDISRIKTSIDGTKLVFLIDKGKNPQDLHLKQYYSGLINYLLGNNDAFWSELESGGFNAISIKYVTRLIDVNLGTIYELDDVIFNDCKFDFQLEFRTANNPDGDNNPNNNSYSGGGSSGRGGSSSSNRGDDEDIILGGEVSDSEKVCSIEGSIYSDEENQAYIWACKKGIVAADNIMDANLTNPITRAELDKMLSVYATKLLGMNHVIEEEVTYPDVNDSLGDLAYYIQEGYKLQIMGIHANGAPLSKFLPYSLVTRGEFGTVFSRILYGNGNNIDGDNYYEKHLQLLKSANILQNTDHSLMELRGWILLMLYRSQKVKESNGSLELEEVSSITAG